MQFLKNPLLFIGLFAFAFFLVSESVSYYDELEKAKVNLYKKNKLILKNLTDAQAKNVEILAEVLAIDWSVIRGYVQDDPEIIKEHIGRLWKRVKDEKLTHEIHFFKPPAISFVNFSNFKSIGKDVSSVRKDIEWVTSSFHVSSHALMCKTYAGYRATHPIYDKNGTLLGGVSLGKKVDWIPEAVKQKTELDSFLVYEKNSTVSLAPKYYDSFMKGKSLVGSYILADSTFAISSTVIPSIDFSKEIQSIEIAQKEYTLYSYPIIDFNKNVMGYVCVVSDLETFKEDFFLTALKSFMIVFVSAFVVLLLTRNRVGSLLQEVEFIKSLTKKIKNREFTFLHESDLHEEVSTESLRKLQSNVYSMGLELEKQYVELESENREKSRKLIEQLYRDELTGLGNRAALFRDIEEKGDSALAILNIRNFKEVNDAFGFESGSKILKELALNCLAYVEGGGFSLYRIGNDEYVVTNYDHKSGLEFKNFVKSIIQKVEKLSFSIESDGSDVVIDINLYTGICFEKERSLEKANMALAQAKKQKIEIAIYKPKENTQQKHQSNVAIMSKLTKALKSDDIIVFYQGIVDKNEKMNKYEALVRMRDEEKILSPFVFLELSKRTKYYGEITKTVIEKTFEQVAKSNKSFSINLTADDVLNDETMALVDEKLKHCLSPQRVVFELVESDDLYNLEEIFSFIQKVKAKGVKIAIDDFGTGYSNFSYMMKIKPDYLKIDGSLIKNIDSDENAKKIVRTIVSFAYELNIKTIAEFVHSKSVYEVCRELGVDEFQGYYFSEPAALTKKEKR